MKRLFVFLLGIIAFSGVAIAETTTFKQQILPIDCVYEVVDVGTQKLRYITPDTCPIDPGPPVVTEPVNNNQYDTSAQSATPQDASPKTWAYSPAVALARPAQATGNSEQKPEQVQGSIASIEDSIIQNQDSIATVVIISGVVLVAGIIRIVRIRR